MAVKRSASGQALFRCSPPARWLRTTCSIAGDGEVEIVSSKSNGNIFRGNLFLQSRGSLTLRHGDDNLVERNIFLGYGKDYTGGIRVINRNQIVRENYLEGLRGAGFASALTVMNGVPNSPVNRYVQVTGARIERNTVVDSAQVSLGAGASEERTAAPADSTMRANLFAGVAGKSLFSVEADISGIAFTNNVAAPRAGNGLPSGRGSAQSHLRARRERSALPHGG